MKVVEVAESLRAIVDPRRRAGNNPRMTDELGHDEAAVVARGQMGTGQIMINIHVNRDSDADALARVLDVPDRRR
jgi:hypothetical protein